MIAPTLVSPWRCAIVAMTLAASSVATGQTRPAAPTRPAKDRPMTSQRCGNDPLSRSSCMIELLLADVKAHYGSDAGGGIAGIKAASSTSYTVTLPREERQLLVTYEFEVKDGNVTLKGRREGTQSF